MVEMSKEEIIKLITEKVVEAMTAGGSSFCSGDTSTCSHCGKCVVKTPDAVSRIVEEGAARISGGPGVGDGGNVDRKLASMIDHTLLKPDAKKEELTKICEEARRYGFATVCVNSANIPLVARLLRGSQVKPIAVVGFPLGAASPQSKAFEAKEAIASGAREIDMVINIGALKSKDYKLVFEDIRGVVEVSRPYPVKVIIETSELTTEEKVAACVLSKTAGAAFVKTSTGFAKGGATAEDIALIRKVVGSDMAIKASGGIRTKEDAEKMVKAGANRVGASASVVIVTGKKGTGSY